MLRVARFAMFFLFLFSSLSAGAGSLYTPPLGSQERKDIMDALRSPVEGDLKRPVIFKVESLNVQDGWAFLRGTPIQPGGRRMDYRGTVYQEAIKAGAFDDGICALLRRQDGAWQTVKYVIGATDVPYVDWDKEYHAPSAIFGIPR